MLETTRLHRGTHDVPIRSGLRFPYLFTTVKNILHCAVFGSAFLLSLPIHEADIAGR